MEAEEVALEVEEEVEILEEELVEEIFKEVEIDLDDTKIINKLFSFKIFLFKTKQ